MSARGQYCGGRGICVQRSEPWGGGRSGKGQYFGEGGQFGQRSVFRRKLGGQMMWSVF